MTSSGPLTIGALSRAVEESVALHLLLRPRGGSCNVASTPTLSGFFISSDVVGRRSLRGSGSP